MSTCLPKEEVQALKNAFKNKELTIEQLYSMSTNARKELFIKYVPKESAVLLNASLEKLVAKKQADGMRVWVEQTFTNAEKKSPSYKDMVERINKLQEGKMLTTTEETHILEDFVSQKIGVTLNAEEIKQIDKLSSELQELEKQPGEYGNPPLEYFKKRRELINYIESKSPSSSLAIASGLIGRGNLLFGAKSGLTNIISNFPTAITEAIVRRAANLQVRGGGARKDFIDYAVKVYKESGFDVVRAARLQDERVIRGEGVLSAQGEGAIRKVGRFYEDFVFSKLMGIPDMYFSAFAYTDEAALLAQKIADQNNAPETAEQIFNDAMSLQPSTEMGQMVREVSMESALYATYQHQNIISELLLKTRNAIDESTGDLKLGTNLEPFVKTPASVTAVSAEYGGITLPFALRNIWQGVKTQDTKMRDKGIRSVVRAGVGLTAVAIIASMIDEDDYISEYGNLDTSQKKLVELGNATYNSVKIGDTWVSVDYFGSLAIPLVAALKAKKAWKNAKDEGISVGSETFFASLEAYRDQFLKLPMINKVVDIVKYMQESQAYDRTGEEHVIGVLNSLPYNVYVRSVPMIISDVAKAIDEYKRRNDYTTINLDQIKQQIPFVRETLPEKVDYLGNKVPLPPGWQQILFGSRVGVANNDPIFEEMKRLSDEGQVPTMNTWRQRKDGKQVLQGLIEDERFDEVTYLDEKVGEAIADAYRDVLKNEKYSKLKTDEEKKEALNNAREKVVTKYMGSIKKKYPQYIKKDD